MTTIEVTPALRVAVSGEPVDRQLEGAVTALRVTAVLSQPTQCELSLSLVERPAVDTAFTVGSALRVEVGGERGPVFEGEITALEHLWGPDGLHTLRVRGYDRLHRLRKRQSVRVHEHVSVQELARTLAEDLGVRVTGAEGARWDRIVQHRQSDLELLQETCARAGLHFQLTGDELALFDLGGVERSVFDDEIELKLGVTVHEARIELNADASCRRVVARGWSTRRAEPLGGEVDEPRVGRDLLEDVAPECFGVSGERTLTGERADTEQQLEALARAELDGRVATEVTLWAVADGDARIRPGVPVWVTGSGRATDGRFVPAVTTHTVDALGYRCELDSRPPARPARDRAATLTLGVVTDVDDPDGLGRVRTRLPAFDDVETTWIGVVVPGAGAEKGIIALPDVDDDVVVALAHGDPDEGVVLGGLYGTTAPPDPGVAGSRVRRYTFRTPGGQSVALDDVVGRVDIHNTDGSRIELAPERMLVRAATDLVIEAPGRNVTIRAKRVDFEDA